MKRYLFFLFLFVTLISFAETDNHSVIKFIRQDDYVSTFSLFANDTLIGKIGEEETLNWQQETGNLTIVLTNEKAELPIELNILPNHLYEIYFKSDTYTVRTYQIAQKEVTEKEAYPFYFYLLPVFLIAFLIILFRHITCIQNYKLAKQFFQQKKYPQAIVLFQKLISTHRKKCEFWNELEIAYICNQEFDKADICKEHIKELLGSKKRIQTEEKDFPTLSDIAEELNRKGLGIAKLSPIKKIDKGKSNFGKYLVEVITKKTFITRFAVLKLPDHSKVYSQNDLLREEFGYKYLKKHWQTQIERHLPYDVVLLSTPKSDVLFSYYAEENKTKEVKTLLSSLETDFNSSLSILNNIRSLYLDRFNKLELKHKKNRNAFLHIKETLSDKMNDICSLEWNEFGINPQKRLLNLHGNLLPNAIYFLCNKKKWSEKNFSLFYDVLHGDLNPENCMVTSLKNFVFIDFEKVGEKPFFYDISFLSTCFLQHFLLEKEVNVENNTNPILQSLYEFFYDAKSSLLVSSNLANVHSIFENLFPNRIELEENEQTGLDISFFCALILRSYYELRDSKRKNRKIHLKNGLLLYSLACVLMDKSKFVDVTNAKISNAFDFPLS